MRTCGQIVENHVRLRIIVSVQFGPQDPESVQKIHSDLSRAILVSIITNINQLHLSALDSELLQALLSKINKLLL